MRRIAGHKLVKELLEEVSDAVVFFESAGSLLALATQFTPQRWLAIVIDLDHQGRVGSCRHGWTGSSYSRLVDTGTGCCCSWDILQNRRVCARLVETNIYIKIELKHKIFYCHLSCFCYIVLDIWKFPACYAGLLSGCGGGVWKGCRHVLGL